jgi:hypothetical protein
MGPLLKDFLWSSWAIVLGIIAVFDWHTGQLPGFWAWAICWLCFGYMAESLHATALSLRQGEPR